MSDGGVRCAVPEERAVPVFLRAGRWEFERKVDDGEAMIGFDRRAAATGVRFNGFYLFESFRAS